jgi:hypothetical protein
MFNLFTLLQLFSKLISACLNLVPLCSDLLAICGFQYLAHDGGFEFLRICTNPYISTFSQPVKSLKYVSGMLMVVSILYIFLNYLAMCYYLYKYFLYRPPTSTTHLINGLLSCRPKIKMYNVVFTSAPEKNLLHENILS